MRLQCLGFGGEGVGCRAQSLACAVQSLGIWDKGAVFRVQGEGVGFHGFRIRVCTARLAGSGRRLGLPRSIAHRPWFRVEGVGMRV